MAPARHSGPWPAIRATAERPAQPAAWLSNNYRQRSGSVGYSLSGFVLTGSKVNFCPATVAWYMAPPFTIVKTAIPL